LTLLVNFVEKGYPDLRKFDLGLLRRENFKDHCATQYRCNEVALRTAASKISCLGLSK